VNVIFQNTLKKVFNVNLISNKNTISGPLRIRVILPDYGDISVMGRSHGGRAETSV